MLPLKPRTDSAGLYEAEGAVGFPSEWTREALQAATTKTVQIFLGFSRFPAVRTIRDGSGETTVRWIDLRFVRGGAAENQATNNELFTVTVRLDSNGRILEERLGR